MLAVVVSFVSVGSARAESPARCAQEVREWCSYQDSGVRSPVGFQNYLSRNAVFCEKNDYRGTRGESGINTKLRTFRMRDGSVTTILIHTPSGVYGKCQPEKWDFSAAFGQETNVNAIVQTQNKLWASTSTGNLLFMRLGPTDSARRGRPEWYAVKTEGGQVLNRVAKIEETPRRDGIYVTYRSGRTEEFKADDTAGLMRSGRTVSVTPSDFNSY
ncbi:MAG TPA: hypothetical protein VM598_08265 [Bdellovibrionota bacterium]|nr:hypothetical protein [Bdellovibrionota bacterium]